MRRLMGMLIIAVLVGAAPPARAASAGSAGAVASGDFDGDGFADVAVGAPSEAKGGIDYAGVVHVLYGSANGLTAQGDQLWWQDAPGVRGAAQEGDLFGYALAAGDFDNDGRDDLAIGVIGHNANGMMGAGAVHILYGSNNGLTAAGDRVISPATNGVEMAPGEFDRFGGSLASGNLGKGGADDLAVAAPAADVSGSLQAGSVTVVYGSGDGLRGTGSDLLHQDVPDIEDDPGANEEFGLAVAIGDVAGSRHGDLAIGVPGETVDDVGSAGGVHVLRGSDSGVAVDDTATFLTQDTPGMGTTPEIADSFGWSLAIADLIGTEREDLAIGTPVDRVGDGAVDGGSVSILRGATNGPRPDGAILLSQASAQVPEDPEAMELFGNTLTAANLGRGGKADLVVGVPSSTVDTTDVAGLVHVFYGSDDGFAPGDNQVWHPGETGIGGQPHPFAQFGSSMAAADLGRSNHADLFVGAPHDEVAGMAGAGSANAFYGGGTGLTNSGDQVWHQDRPGVREVAEPDDGFARGEIRVFG